MTAQALDVFRCPLDGSTLIEASAGTGKTWNICGLYLRLLLERRLEVQQILVVTFTNAATAELRERIRTRIAETLAHLRGTGPAVVDPFVGTLLHALKTGHGLAEPDMALRLDLALQTFDEASIFTIHGFCQRALADTPFTSGLPMALELLTDDTDLRMEVVHDFWRSHVAGEALAPALAGHLLASKDSPEKWDKLLKRRLAKPMSAVLWPAALDEAPVGDPAALAAALGTAHAAARATWQAERERIVGCVMQALPRLNGNVYKDSSVQTAAASWDATAGRQRSAGGARRSGEAGPVHAGTSPPQEGPARRRRPMPSSIRPANCWRGWTQRGRRWPSAASVCCAGCWTRRRRGCARSSANAASSPSTTCSSTCTSGSRAAGSRGSPRRCGRASRRR